MSTKISRSNTVAGALAWLRSHLSTDANLRTDSRAVKSGDGFLAYAVEGADNRTHIDDAIGRGAKAIVLQPLSVSAIPLQQAVPVHEVIDLDQLAGEIASEWYGTPSASLLVFGVTGTNGKTSLTQWLAQALTHLGQPTALIGTLGVGMPERLVPTGFTTPNAAQLQQCLADLKREGAVAVAMEVSSHALHQGRVNGTQFDVAVFTNLTQDHLDYHHTFVAYEAAKARLFDWPGLRYAVINQDDAAGRRLLAHAAQRANAQDEAPITIAYGIGLPDDAVPARHRLYATDVRATAAGGTALTVHVQWADAAPLSARIEVGTLGDFNVSNLLGVLGALLAQQDTTAQASEGSAKSAMARFNANLQALARLQPVAGRMQRLGGRANNDEPLLVIDYAHTPDALEKTLLTLRPLAQARGGELIVVFGCGGDRDAAKRPLMGEIAARLADAVVLTSDNPRSEAPGAIIDQIAAGITEASHCIDTTTDAVTDTANADADATVASSTPALRRFEDRASAILQAVRTAHRADVILLAGKGHEATQEIMGKKRLFSDQDHAQLALASRATHLRGEAE